VYKTGTARKRMIYGRKTLLRIKESLICRLLNASLTHMTEETAREE
jgi:hypothetical protein